MFGYYRVNDHEAGIAPDVFVVFGVTKHMRRSYMIWREGKAPDFVMEIASEGAYDRYIGEKRDRYAAMGVGGYWQFDPLRECFDPPLPGEWRCQRRKSATGRWKPCCGSTAFRGLRLEQRPAS